MIHQDFLSDQENTARCLITLVIKYTIGPHKLHQVDRRQVASRVVQEHVLTARIAGVDAPAGWTCMPLVDRRVVLHAGITTMPCAFSHPAQQFACIVFRWRSARLIADPTRLPPTTIAHCFHKRIGNANR